MTQGQYVFIESRDPFESTDTAFVADAAIALRERGREVSVFLLQNGVLATRSGTRRSPVSRLVEAGVSVLADDFSLRERGIEASDCRVGVQEASIGTLVDLMMRPNTKTVWH
jgi:sulfur relay (sulfurtransferase) DsrF/TusC family protein